MGELVQQGNSSFNSNNAISIETKREQVSDSRSGFGIQSVVSFYIQNDSAESIQQIINRVLKSRNAAALSKKVKSKIDLQETAPTDSQIILLSGSNSRPFDRRDGAKVLTTQLEDVTALGCTVASNTKALILALGIYEKAQQVGLDLTESCSSWESNQKVAWSKLSGNERDLLLKLSAGTLRSETAELSIDSAGDLQISFGSYKASDSSWVLAEKRSQELSLSSGKLPAREEQAEQLKIVLDKSNIKPKQLANFKEALRKINHPSDRKACAGLNSLMQLTLREQDRQSLFDQILSTKRPALLAKLSEICPEKTAGLF